MWLNKGIPTLPTLKKCQIPFGLGFVIPFRSGFRHPSCSSGYRHQASGIIVPIIANFTVLLFYFFEKKKYWNIGTFRLIVLKLLKYKDKIEVFCSKMLQYARTYVYQHFFTYDF